VLKGFREVLRPGGHAYLTVELPDGELPRAAGVLVDGEVLEDDASHFYPERERVLGWLEGRVSRSHARRKATATAT
jgi:hypothetical protein